MGIGDWPNPQSPIPNPQSPSVLFNFIFKINLKYLAKIFIFNLKKSLK